MGYRSDDLKRPAYVPQKQRDFLVLAPLPKKQVKVIKNESYRN